MKRVVVSLVVFMGFLMVIGVPYAQQLDQKTQQALIDAIQDEYKAKATYQKVIDKLGAVRPFSNIIKAEVTHIEALKVLFNKYGVAIPKDDWYRQVPAFATLQEACAAGVKAEIDNVKIYDGLLGFVKEPDIVDTFKRLQRASQDNHLPAFQRCAETPGQGRGKGK